MSTKVTAAELRARISVCKYWEGGTVNADLLDRAAARIAELEATLKRAIGRLEDAMHLIEKEHAADEDDLEAEREMIAKLRADLDGAST